MEEPLTNDLRVAIDTLMAEAGITKQKSLIRRILANGVGLGNDQPRRLDLKITAAAVEEMRDAFRLFKPFDGVPKVTVFGSARTQHQDPLWIETHAVATRLADLGWMVVTGAGPGIMEAAATGAGPVQSLGVSIRLPFEELPEHVDQSVDNRVVMKYFFTRKLMLVKESSAFICLPGGFGTMDETFELLTLQQTGKMVPVPIVLLDEPGGTFWQGFKTFVTEHLEGGGMISPGDLDRVLITNSVDEALAEITHFWSNYHSLRWQAERLVIRLRHAPTDAEIEQLNSVFAPLLHAGHIECTAPLETEVADGDELERPRIVFVPKHRAVGSLFRLIRALNDLPSAARSRVVST